MELPMPEVKFKRLDPDAVMPSYAKPGDAGMDLTATSYQYLNKRHVYGTGLAMEIPEGYVGLIFPRSSITKYDLRLTNAVGVIDSGYRGEICFHFESQGMHGRAQTKAIFNGLEMDITIPIIYNIGDRIGQLVIMYAPQSIITEVDTLSESVRGTGGYGSSGK
jgi:dUTP pyrophosphatase